MTTTAPVVFSAQRSMLGYALRAALPFTANEHGSAALQGARITLVEEGLRITATDSFKAARQVIPLAPRKADGAEVDVMLRRWAIEHLLDLIEDEGDWADAELVDFELTGSRLVVRPSGSYSSDVAEVAINAPATSLPPVVERFFGATIPADDDVYLTLWMLQDAVNATAGRHGRTHIAFRRLEDAGSRPFMVMRFDHSDTNLEVVIGFAAKPEIRQ